MKRQLAFADIPRGAPYVRGSRTSLAAARRVRREPLRSVILRLLRSRGPLTDWDLEQMTGANPSSVRPRRIELVRDGLVMDSGQTRRLPSGSEAILWEAV